MPGVSKASLNRAGAVYSAATLVAAWALRVDHRRLMEARGRAGRCGGDVLKARRLALYLTIVIAGVSVRATHEATGIDRKTIKHHIGKVEDDRDDPALDGLFDAFELLSASATVTGRVERRLAGATAVELPCRRAAA